MSEGNGVVQEVPATVESTESAPMAKGMPDPALIRKMLMDMDPADREKLFQIGRNMEEKLKESAAASAAAPAPPTPAAVPPVQAPAPAAPAAAAPAPASAAPTGPEFPSIDPPQNYVRIPDGVYLWTPQGSEGIPLRGLLAYGRKREGALAGRLVFKLLSSSYAFTRAGRRIVVPPGGWVMMTLTDMLEPFLQYTENKDGCINMWIRALGEIAVDGGGSMFAYDVRFEPSAENPGQPRLFSRTLLTSTKAA